MPSAIEDVIPKEAERGRDEQLLAAYTHALELAPDDPDCYIALGRALILQHLYSEAVAVYERALRIDAERADIHVELGNALYLRGAEGDVSRAFDQYGRAMQIDPTIPRPIVGSPVSIPIEASGRTRSRS